jgi:hypothetical protein
MNLAAILAISLAALALAAPTPQLATLIQELTHGVEKLPAEVSPKPSKS